MALKGRGPVEYLNRQRKAMMVEAFLQDAIGSPINDYKILDVGCGNGWISNYFAGSNKVVGVDVQDKRKKELATFQYQCIEDECLPFKENSFDIVLSHHVIEHVNDQIKHLAEMKRVVKDNGYIYLGCPNKSSPFMAGHVGNDMVPTWADIVSLFERSQLSWQEYYTKLLSEPEKYYCEINIGKYVPARLIKIFKPWYPGHYFILRL